MLLEKSKLGSGRLPPVTAFMALLSSSTAVLRSLQVTAGQYGHGHILGSVVKAWGRAGWTRSAVVVDGGVQLAGVVAAAVDQHQVALAADI